MPYQTESNKEGEPNKKTKQKAKCQVLPHLDPALADASGALPLPPRRRPPPLAGRRDRHLHRYYSQYLA
uniref:Uncharacterized protein n=1 Tax=Arundo donax TaxID=35708 RepID=A0A0A9F6P4_ARUDO